MADDRGEKLDPLIARTVDWGTILNEIGDIKDKYPKIELKEAKTTNGKTITYIRVSEDLGSLLFCDAGIIFIRSNDGDDKDRNIDFDKFDPNDIYRVVEYIVATNSDDHYDGGANILYKTPEDGYDASNNEARAIKVTKNPDGTQDYSELSDILNSLNSSTAA